MDGIDGTVGREAVDPNEGPRERIMNSAVELIGRRGVHNVTVRDIAADARVNVAAVNYYFSSKEQLTREALGLFIGRTAGLLDLLRDESVPPRQRLEEFFLAYSANMVAHPGVMRSIIHDMIAGGDVPSELLEALRAGVDAVIVPLAEVRGDDPDLEMRVFHLFSSLNYPILVLDRMRDVFRFDYADTDSRERYVRVLLEEVCDAR